MSDASADLAVETGKAPAVRGLVPAKGTRPRFHSTDDRRLGRIIFLLVVVTAVAIGAWLGLRPQSVTTATVARGSAIDAVYAIATVEAFDRVTVKAKISGSIIDLKVREGSEVRRGDLLAMIESPSLKFQLERGKADQWAASQQASTTSPQLAVVEAQARMTEASLKNANDDLGRVQKLVASGAAAVAELDRATNNVAVLEAQLASQRAQTRALRIDLTAKSSGSIAAVSELAARLADSEVRAPIDGVVLVRFVEPGELVPPNGPIFKIGDVKSLVLECSVDEADIGRLAVGKKAAVSLYAFPKQVFRGQVFEILPDADRTKKSFVVKVRLEDPPAQLRSGMSGEVNIIVDEHANVLLAPSEAIDVANSVWVLRGDRVEKRFVEVGVRDMLRTEILSGLVDGDQVVVTGMDDLASGTKVRVTMPSAAVTPSVKPPSRGGSSL